MNGCPNLSQCEFSPTSTAKERNIPTSGTPSNSQINNRQTKERLGEAVTKLNPNVQSKESELQSKSQQLQDRKNDIQQREDQLRQTTNNRHRTFRKIGIKTTGI